MSLNIAGFFYLLFTEGSEIGYYPFPPPPSSFFSMIYEGDKNVNGRGRRQSLLMSFKKFDIVMNLQKRVSSPDSNTFTCRVNPVWAHVEVDRSNLTTLQGGPRVMPSSHNSSSATHRFSFPLDTEISNIIM
eukprot:GHVL01042194.1.p1 GENE.GHVL01042194.1~~GHVL01042194.1.p1  ORF type:complete len:131 (-),score=4.84 GHVL01042194.1:237-629(-)